MNTIFPMKDHSKNVLANLKIWNIDYINKIIYIYIYIYTHIYIYIYIIAYKSQLYLI